MQEHWWDGQPHSHSLAALAEVTERFVDRSMLSPAHWTGLELRQQLTVLRRLFVSSPSEALSQAKPDSSGLEATQDPPDLRSSGFDYLTTDQMVARMPLLANGQHSPPCIHQLISEKLVTQRESIKLKLTYYTLHLQSRPDSGPTPNSERAGLSL
jgi:hypothetical protein